MSGCSIHTKDGLKEWSIDPESIQRMYPLLEEKIEIAGKYIVDEYSKRNHILYKYITQKGNSDSVQAPEGIVNFHTHPYSCYSMEETVWGWPSAEDIRETILFTQKGSVAHFVLAVEGVYMLQVNPCIIQTYIHIEYLVKDELNKIYKSKKALGIYNKIINNICKSKYNSSEKDIFFKDKEYDMKKLKYELKEYNKNGYINNYLLSISCDIFRGIIVLCLEIYFRATHRFRLHDINSDNYMTPDDFIKFVNSFKLVNIFSKGKDIKGCGNLTCSGVPVFETRKSTQKFNSYLIDYEKSTGFYLVNNHGDTLSLHMTLYSINNLFPYIKDLLIQSKPKCKNRYRSGNFTWKDNWFHMTMIPNLIKINNKLIRYDSKELTGDDRFNFIKSKEHNIYIDGIPKFYYFSINGDCDHKHVSIEMKKNDIDEYINNNNINNIIVVGSDKCIWTKRLTKLLNNHNKVYDYKIYKTIKEAVNGANKFYNKYIDSIESDMIDYIPAVFIEDTKGYIQYIGGYDSAEKLINNMRD